MSLLYETAVKRISFDADVTRVRMRSVRMGPHDSPRCARVEDAIKTFVATSREIFHPYTLRDRQIYLSGKKESLKNYLWTMSIETCTSKFGI